jgi:hypothetical protein
VPRQVSCGADTHKNKKVGLATVAGFFLLKKKRKRLKDRERSLQSDIMDR